MPAPSYDPLGSMTAGTQAGLAIAAQIGSNQDRALRLQQLRSQQALQRLQEQQIAQKMAYEMQAHDLMVQQMADTQKANIRFQALTTPSFQAPDDIADLGYDTVPNPIYQPNTGKAMIQAYGPVTRDPMKLFMDAATVNYHEAEARRQDALSKVSPKPLSNIGKMQYDRELALQNGDYESAKQIDDSINKLHSTAASDVQKMVDEHKRLTGKDFTPQEVDKLYRIKAGIDPKAAVVQPLTFEKFADKHLEDFMTTKRHFDPKTKELRKPASVEEAMGDMRLAYDNMQTHIKGLAAIEAPLNYEGASRSPAGVDQSVPASIAPPPPSPAAPAEKTIWVRDSAGNLWNILESKLESAKKKDPKLIVVETPGSKG